MNLNARIERKEPRLSDGWDLRSILHLEKNKTCALTVVVRKIDGLRLQFCKNGLDGRAELSGLRGRVSGLHGDVYLQQEPHSFPPDSLCCWIHAAPSNDATQQPGPLGRQYTTKPRHAAPVCLYV